MTAGPRVAIVVLGDLGRSPRMQYHALALADAGAYVDLIGYEGRPPDRAVLDHRDWEMPEHRRAKVRTQRVVNQAANRARYRWHFIVKQQHAIVR